ncbi:GNAT family N-acetyltransferase [Alkalibacterium kapii]|uniref:N-acetyltransferase domain-containing protein n=1 Tax=Alkalibacterium kapii TaxID=426704 RepID=A0A511AT49_9LACT|nr:GNAT family N-acetyltransferase [Alkalibacterium kapii]GEK91379.1 hypothetical protein AKA01nite_10010 [Alkalibacterium kapii]
MNYKEDLTISKSYAEAMRTYYDRLFNDPSVRLVLASYQGSPAASCILIRSDEGFEVDDLFTLPAFRRKGIARALLDQVVTMALKTRAAVFLLVDAEDSPKEIYLNSGFERVGFRIGAQKIIGEGVLNDKTY